MGRQFSVESARMLARCQILLFAALFSSATLRCVNAASFQVFVDVSAAPDAQTYIGPVKALFEEWYPKINDALFGGGAPLPFHDVRVIFERNIEFETAPGKEKETVPAYSKD